VQLYVCDEVIATARGLTCRDEGTREKVPDVSDENAGDILDDLSKEVRRNHFNVAIEMDEGVGGDAKKGKRYMGFAAGVSKSWKVFMLQHSAYSRGQRARVPHIHVLGDC